MWNYVRFLGKDLFVSPWAGMGAPPEERAQPMEDAKNIKTAMFTDYPKGKQITAIMQAEGILISAYLLFLPDYLYESRAQTKQHTPFELMVNPQQMVRFKQSTAHQMHAKQCICRGLQYLYLSFKYIYFFKQDKTVWIVIIVDTLSLNPFRCEFLGFPPLKILS